MWIGFDDFEKDCIGIYLAIGKAVKLCQNYEINFQHIMTIIQIEENIKDKKIKKYLDQEWKDTVSKVSKWLLGKHNKKLSKLGVVSDKSIEKLNQGRISRNAICHGITRILGGSLQCSELLSDEAEVFRHHVISVSKADNIVSSWVWQLNEKDPAPVSEQKYVRQIEKWVFGNDFG